MAKSPQKIRIFSALEVANLCGVVNQTAINWIRNGYLRAFMTPGGQYRIYQEDLVAFLQDRSMRVPSELELPQKPDVDWNLLAIIDDDRQLNDLMKRFFERLDASFTIIQAFDGFEAGALMAEKRPGFVILDIDLPGSGWKPDLPEGQDRTEFWQAFRHNHHGARKSRSQGTSPRCRLGRILLQTA